MAVLTLTVNQMPAKYPTLPIGVNTLDVAFTAAGADFADGTRFILTGKEILIAKNVAVAAKTLTITSQADPLYKRTGHITTYSIGASEYAVFPQFQVAGWADASGYVNMLAESADIQFLVLRLTD